VLYVGDGDWRKNASGMLQALAETRRTDCSIELVWVGAMSTAAYDRARHAHAQLHGVEQPHKDGGTVAWI
jgi:hypothetical protein